MNTDPHTSDPAPKAAGTTDPRRLAVMNVGAAGEILRGLSAAEEAAILARARPEDRAALVERSPRPAELVPLLPADDLMTTVYATGIEDAVVLLEHAELEQIDFVADVFLWRDLTVDPEQAMRWLASLAACGQERTLEWFRSTEPELAVAVLQRCFAVATIDEEYQPPQFETEIPNFTLDGTYYVAAADQERLAVGRWILTVLRSEEVQLYRSLLEGVIWDTAAESEEEAISFRQRRLATFGFPDLDEALDIYRDIPPEQRREHVSAESRDGSLAAVSPTVLARREPMDLPASGLFLEVCLRRIDDRGWHRDFFGELGTLANHVQVADGLPLCEHETRRTAFARTVGYVNIALEAMVGSRVGDGVALLRTSFARPLFQVGHARVNDVAERARDLLRRGWLSEMPGRSERLDSPWRETIDGLGRARPVAFDPQSAPPSGIREFRDLNDVAAAEDAVEVVMATGRFLVERLGLTPELVGRLVAAAAAGDAAHPVVFSSILLTAIAHRLIDEPFAPLPLTPEQAAAAIARLRSRDAGRPGLDDEWVDRWIEEVEPFLDGFDGSERGAVARFVRWCWARLDDEFGRLPAHTDPDPRFVSALIISAPSPSPGDEEPPADGGA